MLVSVACTGPTATPAPDDPVSSDDPTPIAPPEPTGGEYEYREASVDGFDILILESFPVQVNVVVRGNLPDGCTEIDEATAEGSGDTFTVQLTTRRPVDEICTQALVPFEQSISLDVVGLPAGEYTVDVYGETQTFTLDADNVLPDDPDSGSSGDEPDRVGTSYGLASVTDVEVFQAGSGPQDVQVIIRGYLPDPCTDIHRISEQLEGSTVRVTVETRRESDTMCAQVIEDFEVAYALSSLPGRGTYVVSVNGVEAQFTVP